MTYQLQKIREDAILLAGKTEDLVQRAAVYHHMYLHSGRNHTFPLLAAHGALWGSGFFSAGLKVGRILALQNITNPQLRLKRLQDLGAFAEAFREINRLVCVETYTAYHVSALYPDHPNLEAYVPAELIDLLSRCNHACQTQTQLSLLEKRSLFRAFFLWEQNNIVGPGVDAAVRALDWPLAKWVALKPAIGFRYFNTIERLWFSDFASQEERIEKGLAAFDIAERVGWSKVDKTLNRYGIMPRSFLEDPKQHFQNVKYDVLGLG